MTTPSEARLALIVVTDAAVAAASDLLGSMTGAPDARRAGMLEAVPELIAYYADGTAALAADFYEDSRERAGAPGRFTAEPVVADRAEKIRRAIAWSAAPMFGAADGSVGERLAQVVQLETARPFRDTITTNRRRDPQSVGWRRVAAGGCKFCLMLAERGAVYREDTARFASHPNCHCGAEPVFRSNDTGETASVLQYVASKRTRTPAQSAKLRDYLNRHYPDAHG
jgi:hypothetical protein